MADRAVDILLVGGGVASATAAATLAQEGFDGTVLLAARELDPPYERPPLTKEYLRGVSTRADAHVATGDAEVLVRTGVMKLDSAAREATLATKEVVAYDRALLATGAMVRRLQVDGTELEGLHYIRTFGNSDALRTDVAEAEHVVCVGGSYIACEVAASLTAMGIAVTMVMQEAVPFERGFGPRVGAWFRDRLQERGVAFITEDDVARFAGTERLERVITRSGREVEAQAAVLGVGVMPDVMLARSAGLDLGESGGIACDDRLRTSALGVWAAGDVCEYDSVVHGRRLRVEHTEHAAAQGAHAARAMLGHDGPYDVVPYFFSDLSDWASLEYVGPAASWDEEVVTGSMDEGTFGVWYLEDGRVRGALSVGGGLDLDRARELLVAGEPVAATGLE